MIEAVILRLREKCKPTLRSVDGAAAFAMLKAVPAQLPAAHVIPLGTAGGQNRLVNAVRQSVTERVGVIIWHGNLRDARGEAASLEITEVRDLVRTSLIGWGVGGGWGPLTLASGDLVRVTDGVLAWQDVFACDGHLRGS